MYRVDVTSANFHEVMGMQYTLSYLKDRVDVEAIEAGALNITENHYYRYAPGVITSSWSEADAMNLSSDEVLFTIVLKAKSAVQLRDVLSLNSRVTPVEAYAADGLKDEVCDSTEQVKTDLLCIRTLQTRTQARRRLDSTCRKLRRQP